MQGVDHSPQITDDESDMTSTENEGNHTPVAHTWMDERRLSVSAEVISPLKDGQKREHKVIEKSEKQRHILRSVLQSNILFDSVDKDVIELAVDAMEERPAETGDIILEQGQLGNHYFYIISEGDFEVTKIVDEDDNEDDGVIQVAILSASDGFGEDSILYNAPQSNTVTCMQGPARLWMMDRVTFREILMDTTLAKRELYKDFLEKVPLLEPLTEYERYQVADALVPLEFEAGEYVLYQGDKGETFFILEQGTVEITKEDIDHVEPVRVATLGPGAYFGELALLLDQPRLANVVAMTNIKVLGLSRAVFTRLLGPCQEVVNRNVTQYRTIYEVTGKPETHEDAHDYPEMFGMEELERKGSTTSELNPEFKALQLMSKNLERMAAQVFRESQLLNDEVTAFIEVPLVKDVPLAPGVETFDDDVDNGGENGENVDDLVAAVKQHVGSVPHIVYESESEDEDEDDPSSSGTFRRGSGLGMDLGPIMEDMVDVD